MCTYYYLHHHHIPPCSRAIDFVVHYGFCEHAPKDPSTGRPMPCQKLQFEPGQSVDYNDPCASGGCLASPNCSSGACRVDQLNGVWVCCKCHRGGNVHSWCSHRMRATPDTFCYHVCCERCQTDLEASPIQPVDDMNGNGRGF